MALRLPASGAQEDKVMDKGHFWGDGCDRRHSLAPLASTRPGDAQEEGKAMSDASKLCGSRLYAHDEPDAYAECEKPQGHRGRHSADPTNGDAPPVTWTDAEAAASRPATAAPEAQDCDHGLSKTGRMAWWCDTCSEFAGWNDWTWNSKVQELRDAQARAEKAEAALAERTPAAEPALRQAQDTAGPTEPRCYHCGHVSYSHCHYIAERGRMFGVEVGHEFTPLQPHETNIKHYPEPTAPAGPTVAELRALVAKWREGGAMSQIGPLHSAGINHGFQWAADELAALLPTSATEPGGDANE